MKTREELLEKIRDSKDFMEKLYLSSGYEKVPARTCIWTLTYEDVVDLLGDPPKAEPERWEDVYGRVETEWLDDVGDTLTVVFHISVMTKSGLVISNIRVLKAELDQQPEMYRITLDRMVKRIEEMEAGV